MTVTEVVDAVTFQRAMRERVEAAGHLWQDAAAVAKRTAAAPRETKAILASVRPNLPKADLALIEAVAGCERHLAAVADKASQHALDSVFAARAALDVADRHVELGQAGAFGAFYGRQRPASAPAAPAAMLTEDAALAAPTLSLAALTASGDPRAEALWFRCGDNSVDNHGELGHQQLADYLRRQRPAGVRIGYLEAVNEAIESVMAQSRLRFGIVGYRGVGSLSWFQLPRSAESVPAGHVFTDRNHVSVSTSLVYAATWGRRIARIVAPAGTPAVRMDDRDPGCPEMEVLLGSELRYRTGASHWLRPGPRGDDLLLIDVHVIS